MSDPSSGRPAPGQPDPVAARNVAAIAALERQALERRSPGERVSDAVVRLIGSLSFVSGHLFAFALWMLWNSRWVPRLPVFDPFPFGILTLIVSSEGVLLALFILISQNRMIRQADHRAHLNLQVSLLAEEEATQLLRSLRRIEERLGLEPSDEEQLKQLSEETNLPALAQELKDKVPEE